MFKCESTWRTRMNASRRTGGGGKGAVDDCVSHYGEDHSTYDNEGT